jgi:hypothetical protein
MWVGLVSLMVGFMWLMCQGQHMDRLVSLVVGFMWLMCQGQHMDRFGISYDWFHVVDVSGPTYGCLDF